jgi:hypothetical protein
MPPFCSIRKFLTTELPNKSNFSNSDQRSARLCVTLTPSPSLHHRHSITLAPSLPCPYSVTCSPSLHLNLALPDPHSTTTSPFHSPALPGTYPTHHSITPSQSHSTTCSQAVRGHRGLHPFSWRDSTVTRPVREVRAPIFCIALTRARLRLTHVPLIPSCVIIAHCFD